MYLQCSNECITELGVRALESMHSKEDFPYGDITLMQNKNDILYYTEKAQRGNIGRQH